MNRRGFISALCATLVAPDPDKLLWRPGARLISIPNQPQKRYVVVCEFIAKFGEQFHPCLTYSASMPKDLAIISARNKKHYHIAQGVQDFKVVLKEYSGRPEFDYASYAVAGYPYVHQKGELYASS